MGASVWNTIRWISKSSSGRNANTRGGVVDAMLPTVGGVVGVML
jgi:hypothetical protein